jgi:hypothetical protein
MKKIDDAIHAAWIEDIGRVMLCGNRHAFAGNFHPRFDAVDHRDAISTADPAHQQQRVIAARSISGDGD